MSVIYHLARQADWHAAEASGAYRGAREDHVDGFMHFSTAAQVADSAARHRRGETDLILLAVDAARLDGALRWEPASSGDTFPHLYRDLPLDAIVWTHPLPVGADGLHCFPPLD